MILNTIMKKLQHAIISTKGFKNGKQDEYTC